MAISQVTTCVLVVGVPNGSDVRTGLVLRWKVKKSILPVYACLFYFPPKQHGEK